MLLVTLVLGTPQAEAADVGLMPTGRHLQVTARGGYSRYGSLGFVTGGAEVGVKLVKGLHAIAGVETYGVKRTLPPDQALEEGVYSRWNWMYPLNIGVIYKLPIGPVEPYAGADAILANYSEGAWTVGGRLRVGADYMFIPHVGANLNVALGAWSGDEWDVVDVGVPNTGFLPQVSGGLVVAF
jgi:hypothetical protein